MAALQKGGAGICWLRFTAEMMMSHGPLFCSCIFLPYPQPKGGKDIIKVNLLPRLLGGPLRVSDERVEIGRREQDRSQARTGRLVMEPPNRAVKNTLASPVKLPAGVVSCDRAACVAFQEVDLVIPRCDASSIEVGTHCEEVGQQTLAPGTRHAIAPTFYRIRS